MQSFIQDFMLREGRNIFYFYDVHSMYNLKKKCQMSFRGGGGGKGEFRLGGGVGGRGSRASPSLHDTLLYIHIYQV